MSNQVTATGKLGNPPELRYSANGKAWATFSIATEHRFKSQDEWQSATTWLRCKTFGEYAEHLAQSAGKGDRITISGRLEQNDYTDKQGNERSTLEIVCNSIAIDLRFATATPDRIERNDERTTHRDRAAAAAADPDPF